MNGERARGDRVQYNQIRKHRVGDMEVEMIHQTLPGDCVLINYLNINYLNTESLVNSDGKIVMSPRELRDIVIQRRAQEGEDASDIMADNSPLSYKDTVRLFETLNGIPAQQQDIVLVSGNNLSPNELRNNIRSGLLEYLDTYESGLCATGMGYHSRTIWKLNTNKYIVIDPMDPNGFTYYDKEELVNYLFGLCRSQPSENNFFYFLRSNENE